MNTDHLVFYSCSLLSTWDRSFIVRRTRIAIPRDKKSNAIQTYGGPKLRFSRGLKAKALGAVTARVPTPTPLVEIFYRPIDWTQEATMVNVRIFFLPWRVFQVYDCYLPTLWRSAPALRFSWRPTRKVSLATILVHSYRRPLDEDKGSLVGTSSRHSQQFCEQFGHFFHQATPSLFSSPSLSAPSFPSPSLFQPDGTTLSPITVESHQTYSSYQLVSHLETSTALFPAIWTKTSGSIDKLFSQWTRPKRASSDQWTDEEDTSETCNNSHVDGWALTKAWKRNWVGRVYTSLATGMVVFTTYIYVSWQWTGFKKKEWKKSMDTRPQMAKITTRPFVQLLNLIVFPRMIFFQFLSLRITIFVFFFSFVDSSWICCFFLDEV